MRKKWSRHIAIRKYTLVLLSVGLGLFIYLNRSGGAGEAHSEIDAQQSPQHVHDENCGHLHLPTLPDQARALRQRKKERVEKVGKAPSTQPDSQAAEVIPPGERESLFVDIGKSKEVPPGKDEYWIARKKYVQLSRKAMKADVFRFNPFEEHNYLIKATSSSKPTANSSYLKGKLIDGKSNMVGKFSLVVVERGGEVGYSGTVIHENGKIFSIKTMDEDSSKVVLEEYIEGKTPPINCKVVD